jgi:LPXTG-motif cell wall-anchored protein
MLLGLLVLGVLIILLNYIDALPKSPANWYTLAGFLSILAGALLATRYR